ncbi:MAG TPA: CHAT domain-containing protein [Terriglobales bacterium]|jgi:CHAT domain-containing protein
MSRRNDATFWSAIAKSRDVNELRTAVAVDRSLAAAGLADLGMLLTHLESIHASKVLDQLRWLGIELAQSAGNLGMLGRLTAQRQQNAALDAIASGDKILAAGLLSSAAAEVLADDFHDELVRVNHKSILLLFRLGEWEAGLDASEAMLARIGSGDFKDERTRIALCEFSRVTRDAPAGDRWANVISHLSAGIRSAGDSSLALPIDSHLAAMLIRAGACEDGLEILADISMPLSGLMQRDAGGNEVRVPEYEAAELARARALDLLGRVAEAEAAYRNLANEFPELRAESLSRLADLLVQNDRLQEGLDLVEGAKAQDGAFAAHANSITAIAYARLNRDEISLKAADQAIRQFDIASAKDGSASRFQQHVKLGVDSLERAFVPRELEWRTRLNLIESGLLRREPLSRQGQEIYRILDWARRFGDRSIQGRCLRLHGEIAIAMGRGEAAMDELDSAFECEMVPAIGREWKILLDRQVPSASDPIEIRGEQWRRSRLEAGVGMGTLLSLGRAKIVLRADPIDSLNAAIAAARRRNRRLVLYYALAAKGKYLRLQGERDAASLVWIDVVDVLEGLRTNVAGIESQIGVLEDKELAYGELMDIAVETGDAISAMRMMERAKSRSLLEEINFRNLAAPLDGQSDQQAREFRQVLIRSINRELTGDGDEEVRLLELKRNFARLYRRPESGPSQQRAAARPEEVADLATTGTVVLQYFVADDHIILAAAHDNRLEPPLRLKCTRSELRELLDSLSSQISTRIFCGSLRDLYSILIEPVEGLLQGGQRLIIVPHRELHMLLFHALQRSSGLYLGQQLALLHAPSVAVAKLASEQWNQRTSHGAVLFAGNETPYSPLPALQAAAVEVDEIVKHLPGATPLKGRMAARRQLLHLDGNIDVLHLACHGEFDHDDPLLSRIYLADGPMYGYEIERLGCRPRLVVLSACETAIQSRAAGDETFGLVRAFLARGAENVVASLWKVADESTALLMGALYRELAKNQFDVPEALRFAQMHLLSTSEYAHPFFWAPFVAMGGSKAREDNSGTEA